MDEKDRLRQRVIAAVNSFTAELKFLERVAKPGEKNAKLEDVVGRVIDRGHVLAKAQDDLAKSNNLL